MTAFSKLTALASCLCEQIATDKLPEPCFCGILPGGVVAADFAGDCDSACGMAWVRLTEAYPSRALGTPYVRPNNCGVELGLTIEVGILRCIPMDEVPSADEMLAASDLQMADMETMRRAILCCDAISTKDLILSQYLPSGPQGGLVGGTWTLTTVA